MKKLLIASSLFFAMLVGTTNSAKAQTITFPDVQIAAGNLVTLQGGLVNVGDITVVANNILNNLNVELIDVVDVSNVLNDLTIQDIQVLSNILNNLKIDNVLNNLLKDANIITGNQVVVGVVALAGGVTQVLVADKSTMKTKRK